MSVDKRMLSLMFRVERLIASRQDENPDALSVSLRELFRECTEEDLKALAGELESDLL